MTALLVLVTLVARVTLVSSPYYVDGPNHVTAVHDGYLFIQPPGYFLFAFAARAVSAILRIPAAGAISAMNVTFSVAGVWIFRTVTRRVFPGVLGLLLAAAYAVSNVVWFAAEIHSTYASMTFFAPLLLYAFIKEKAAWAWVIWAGMAGFRPSDGVFLLPVMAYFSLRRPWRDSVAGILLAVPICAAWYVPTVLHFGGHVIAPFTAASRQLGQLPSGLAVHGVSTKAFNNLLHFLFGTVNAWNVLLPFTLLGLLDKSWMKWAALIWMLPATLFFALYFISDSLYLAFLVAPGILLAGFGLRQITGRHSAIAITTASILLAGFQMLLLRPILPPGNLPIAVLNSYTLEYTRWALQHRYAQRLANAITGLQH